MQVAETTVWSPIIVAATFEQALLRANKKFTKRFKKMEEIATKPLEKYSYDEFNNLWKKAKTLI